MNFWSKVIASAVLTLGLLTGTASANTHLESVLKNTFKLYENDKPICTAIAVKTPAAHLIFLTAAHCVDDINSKYSVRQNLVTDGLRPTIEAIYALDIVAVKSDVDMALFKLASKSEIANGVPIATDGELGVLEFGQEVITIAYPVTLDIAMTKGEFGGLVNSINSTITTPLFRTTAPMIGGSSGGGLYAKFGDTYKLIGTISFGLQGIDFINHVVPINNVRDGLRYVDRVWE